jgi:hypothetical protein
MTLSPSTAKGTQGALGLPVQPLRDAGRVTFAARAADQVGIVAATLITLTPNRDGTDGAGATSLTVTAGKRLRLTGADLSWRNNTAAIGAVQVRIVMTATGAVVAGSPIIATLACRTDAATVGEAKADHVDFPDGFELSGTMQLGAAQRALGAVVGFDLIIRGFEY